MITCLTTKESKYGDKVYYFCKNCGAEIYADLVVWKDSSEILSDREKTQKRVDQFMKMKSCPHCHHNLDYTAGYYFYTYCHEQLIVQKNSSWLWDKDCMHHGFKTKDNFEHMRKLRVSQEQQLAENAVNELIEKLSSESAESIENPDVSELKSDTAKLKDYLNNLIKIEMCIHSLSERLKALYIQKTETDRQYEYDRNTHIAKRNEPVEKARKKYESCVEEYEKAKSRKPGKVLVKMPTEPTPPILEKAGLFNKKKVDEQNALLTAEYEKALREYQQQVQLCEQEKVRREQQKVKDLEALVASTCQKMEEAKKELEEAKNAKKENASGHIATPLAYSKSMIEKEIEEAHEYLSKLIECRSGLYHLNVIFPKYQNWIALTSFYEYLAAGRCNMLEGHEGAYNIYENEIRANLVVNQLSQIAESLEQVKANQNMIYSELVSINQNIDALNTTMNSALQILNNISKNTETMSSALDNISQNTEIIAHNTAVTAYYSKINAELTNSLGYLIALK